MMMVMAALAARLVVSTSLNLTARLLTISSCRFAPTTAVAGRTDDAAAAVVWW